MDLTALGLTTGAKVDALENAVDFAGVTGDDEGADGAFPESYPVTEHPDLATISAGQVTTSQSTLWMSVQELGLKDREAHVGLSAPCIQPQRKPHPG